MRSSKKRGMLVACVSVDPPKNSKAMAEKLDLPFPLLSNPKGDLARCYGVWNAKESVPVPAVVVTNRGSIVRYLYVGNDFADRPVTTRCSVPSSNLPTPARRMLPEPRRSTSPLRSPQPRASTPTDHR
jgi:alkyl hydroperoxide reductase subunit AhpC